MQGLHTVLRTAEAKQLIPFQKEIVGDMVMVMMRHPLSGTEYFRNEDGTVRVVGKNGVEGCFSRLGNWISGERRTADPGLCRWVADGHLSQVDRMRQRARLID